MHQRSWDAGPLGGTRPPMASRVAMNPRWVPNRATSTALPPSQRSSPSPVCRLSHSDKNYPLGTHAISEAAAQSAPPTSPTAGARLHVTWPSWCVSQVQSGAGPQLVPPLAVIRTVGAPAVPTGTCLGLHWAKHGWRYPARGRQRRWASKRCSRLRAPPLPFAHVFTWHNVHSS